MLTISIQAVTSGFDTVWGAVDQALEMFYPKQEPYHYAPMISYMLGGPDPLEGIRSMNGRNLSPIGTMLRMGFRNCMERKAVWLKSVVMVLSYLSP